MATVTSSRWLLAGVVVLATLLGLVLIASPAAAQACDEGGAGAGGSTVGDEPRPDTDVADPDEDTAAALAFGSASAAGAVAAAADCPLGGVGGVPVSRIDAGAGGTAPAISMLAVGASVIAAFAVCALAVRRRTSDASGT